MRIYVYVREMLSKTGKDITLKLQDIRVSSLDDTKTRKLLSKYFFLLSRCVSLSRESFLMYFSTSSREIVLIVYEYQTIVSHR